MLCAERGRPSCDFNLNIIVLRHCKLNFNVAPNYIFIFQFANSSARSKFILFTSFLFLLSARTLALFSLPCDIMEHDVRRKYGTSFQQSQEILNNSSKNTTQLFRLVHRHFHDIKVRLKKEIIKLLFIFRFVMMLIQNLVNILFHDR